MLQAGGPEEAGRQPRAHERHLPGPRQQRHLRDAAHAELAREREQPPARRARALLRPAATAASEAVIPSHCVRIQAVHVEVMQAVRAGPARLPAGHVATWDGLHGRRPSLGGWLPPRPHRRRSRATRVTLAALFATAASMASQAKAPDPRITASCAPGVPVICL